MKSLVVLVVFSAACGGGDLDGAYPSGLGVGEIIRRRRLPGLRTAHCRKAGIDEPVHGSVRQLMFRTDWVMALSVSIALAFAWKLR